MRKLKKLNKFLLIIVVFLINLQSVKALTGTVYCPDDNSPLNIRQSTSATSTRLGSATCGSKLNIIEKDIKAVGGTWHKIEYNGITGYVNALYVTIDNDSSEKGKVLCIENRDPLNIWSDVNKSSKLKSLSCDTEMIIIAKNVANNSKCSNWYSVEYQGVKGYACGKYVGTVDSPNGSGMPSNVNVGKSTTGDNIYKKENYEERVNDGVAACYEDTGDVSLKSTPGGGSKTGTLSCGQNVKINETREGSGTCGYYYNVTTDKNQTGWTCAYFINTIKLSTKAQDYYKNNDLNSYYTSLRDKGFPDSYLPYLAEIHARHPNWNFDTEQIGLDFTTVVENEAYSNRNLLQKSAFNDNYLAMDINSYNILENSFIENSRDKGWYNASSEAIAFYLDPRNYLNEKYIFAFEPSHANGKLDNNSASSAVSNILAPQKFWPTVYSGHPSNVTSDIITATNSLGINPPHIASRIRQEISGLKTTDARIGGNFTCDGRNCSRYYNFFNIVGSTRCSSRYACYAYEHGWDTPYKGIYGGSEFVKRDYIDVNQDTLYYEKFDVSTTNGHYTHQYMQNLAVGVQETNIAFNAYATTSNYLNEELTFIIPVYDNMSKTAVTSPTLGNPNNYLRDLKVNNVTVNGFSYDRYEYDITVPNTTKTINVDGTKIDGNATVKGTGTIEIVKNKQVIEVVVTAQSGRTRIYKITVNLIDVKPEDIVSIPDMMNKSGLKYNDSNIFGINVGTDAGNIVSNIQGSNAFASVSIKDKNNIPKAGALKTGDIVTVSNGRETKNYTVLIYGDINGDGAIDKLDYLAVLRDYYGYAKLSGIYKIAADTNHDGKIDKLDYLAILRDYYGYAKITQ